MLVYAETVTVQIFVRGIIWVSRSAGYGEVGTVVDFRGWEWGCGWLALWCLHHHKDELDILVVYFGENPLTNPRVPGGKKESFQRGD